MVLKTASLLLVLQCHLLLGAENLFGVFDFDLRGATEAEKIASLDEVGFDGFAAAVSNAKSLDVLNERLEVKPDLKVMVGLLHTSCKSPKALNQNHLEKVLEVLAKRKAKLWLIIGGPKDDDKIIKLVRRVSDAAAEKEVTVSLYPHDNTAMETAEHALTILQAADRSNLTISLHQCHELRAGNIDRFDEIIAAIRPHLDFVTICGSDRTMSQDEKNWRDAIKPLGEGDFDPKIVLRALKKADYQGPIILHTFGLKAKPPTHWQTSFQHYQKMMAEISAEDQN